MVIFQESQNLEICISSLIIDTANYKILILQK